jgi:hypothetical protein
LVSNKVLIQIIQVIKSIQGYLSHLQIEKSPRVNQRRITQRVDWYMKSIPKDPQETLNYTIRGQTSHLTNTNESAVDIITETNSMRNVLPFLFNTKASLQISGNTQNIVFDLPSMTPFSSTTHQTEADLKPPCLETVLQFQKPTFKKSSKSTQLSPLVQSEKLEHTQYDNIKNNCHQRKVLGKITAKSPLQISKDAPSSSDIRLTQPAKILEDTDSLNSDESINQVLSLAPPNQDASILVSNEESLQVSHSILDESLQRSEDLEFKQLSDHTSSMRCNVSRNFCDPNQSSRVTATNNAVATEDEVAWAIPRLSHVHYVDFIKHEEIFEDKSIVQENMHATCLSRSWVTKDSSYHYSVHRISNPKFAPKLPSSFERISEPEQSYPEREASNYKEKHTTIENEKVFEAQTFRRSNRQRQKPRRSLGIESQRKRKSILQSKVEGLEYPGLEQTCVIVELPHDIQPGDTMLVEWPQSKNCKERIGMQEYDVTNAPLLFLCKVPKTVPVALKNKKRLLRVMAPGCYEQSEPKRQRIRQSNSSRCLQNDIFQSPQRVNWISFKKSSSRIGGKYQVPSLPALTMQSNFDCNYEDNSSLDG